MAAVSLTMSKPIALTVIAILASSVISIGVSTIPMGGQQGQEGPQGPQGPYLQDYYSGWINITDKTGQYITLDHDLITMMFL